MASNKEAVMETLRRFASNVTDTKVKRKQKIFEELTELVARKDLSDNAVRGVVKLLLPTALLRYQVFALHRLVAAFVAQLSSAYRQQTAAALAEALTGTLGNLKASTLSFSKVALNGFKWLMIVLADADVSTWDKQLLFELSDAISVCLYLIRSGRSQKLDNIIRRKLDILFIKNPTVVEKLVTIILSTSDLSQRHLCFVASVVDVWSKNRSQELLGTHFPTALESYVKSILSAKSKPDVFLLESCKPLLSAVNHDAFKQQLLPNVQKFMLRNPETVVETVAYLLGQVPIDLSAYALDLMKPLGAQLVSKNDIVRNDAALAIKNLAKQCSDQEVCSSMISYLFRLLNGSVEGKLTTVAQRLSALTGIGNLSFHGVSGSTAVSTLCAAAIDSFIPLLKEEAHEQTLIHALKMLASWTGRSAVDVPSSLTTWFSEVLNSKSTAPAISFAYLQCMNVTYHTSNISAAKPLFDVLINIVEKALKQPSMQAVLLEALSATNLLLKLYPVISDTETKFKPVFAAAVEKQLFTPEKFIADLQEEEFLLLLTVVQKLLLEHADKIVEAKAKPFYRALLPGLVHRSYAVRQTAASAVKRLLASLGGASLSKHLLEELINMLKSGQLDKLALTETAEKTAPKEETAETTVVSSKLLAEGVVQLVRVPDIEENVADELIMEALFAFALPRFASCNNDPWLEVLKFYGRDAATFIKSGEEQLIQLIWRSDEQSANISRVLGTYADQTFYKSLLSSIWGRIDDKQLYDVSVVEVDIMKTAEGVLYDKSVLEAKQEAPKANIKRESKAYSYKEQLAEIEMRKELEEKWRREGKLKDELTPKQKEAMQQQLAKESEIRTRLKKLWKPIEKALNVLDTVIETNHSLARQNVVEILENAFPLFKSPLSAAKAVQLWSNMGRACVPRDPYFAVAVAFATLRAAKVATALDVSWTQEPLDEMIRRVLRQFSSEEMRDLIKEPSSQQNGSVDDEVAAQAPSTSVLSSAAFAYFVPLVTLAFEDRRSLLKDGEDLAADVIECVTTTVGTSSWERDEVDATCLPFDNIMSLALTLIGSVDAGRVQLGACNCLLETAMTVEHFAAKISPDVVLTVMRTVLNGLLQPSELVREYALKALDRLCDSLNAAGDKSIEAALRQRLWVACFDVDEGNQALAKKLWEKRNYAVSAQLCEHLVSDVIHHTGAVREAASSAVCSALESHRSEIEIVLNKLCSLYAEKLDFPPPVYDDFGRLISEGGVDEWEARAGVALTLKKLCPLLTEKNIVQYFAIILPDGLNDRSAEVRHLMLSAAVASVQDHGEQQISRLLPMFEKQLDELADDKKHDVLRQSLVVLLGTLAQHLKKEDPKIRPIVAKLVEALSTPSQQVQEAVANCLPPLVPAIREQVPQMIEKLMCLLLDAEQYGERRGAAYGLAGLVKGMGILSLKQFEVMTKLNAAISDKKSARHREGALLAIEMLCNMLGKLFEPYVVHVLPNLLLCFGDPDEHVREAADECAKAVMRHLSAHGVKLVLPSLLSALEEDSWRTKCGSVELLAAMSYCAPKQLSSCLPSIVPKLIEVLSDTHVRVQKAGEHALRQIGQVIKNPEIQAVVNVLLAALEDPAKKTAVCLQKLLHTKFVHYIDSPSLALIMPVIYRAFDDRSTETRKTAAQIVGNIYSLTDQKDVEPYLPKIMPGLKKCLLDPVPEVRAVAARALGAMVRATGESCFDDLVPWLQQTLITPAGSVDRSGAAQGLSEVIGGLGEQHLARVMPEIIQAADSPDVEPHVRDGYIMMYIYLPTVFGDRFLPYVSKIIPSVLKALADENEYVRETALRVGQRIINTYCETAIPLLLPSLERGLFDDSWRIRFSSVQLLGDLLFKVSGVTGKMTTEGGEDDTFGTESASKAVLQALGTERRNRVLAGLYIARSDVALMVRQAAGHVWKVVVSNTPRTLKDILQDLFVLLLGCLASSNYDKQQVASRSLGELVRKMGERILVDVVPVLEHGMKSEQADQRRGVCIALSAIVANISKDMVLMYAENLIPTARLALCDPLPEVRDAAAATFNTLHSAIGAQAMDEILTPLLEKLDDPEIGSYVLDGLRRVLALKSKVFLPYVIPKLTTPPVSTKALAQLASVAGESLNKYLNKILSALLTSFASKLRTPDEEEEKHNCATVISAVSDETGVAIVVDMLLQKASETDLPLKQAAAILLAYFCQHTKEDLSSYIPQLIRGLIVLLAFDDDVVLTSSTDALTALINGMSSKEQLDLVPTIRLALKNAVAEVAPGSLLPGFHRDKTLRCILTVLREGVLNGSAETKEISAYGLIEAVTVSDAAGLKPHVVNITGPLIRILGDRYPPNIKTALLSSLALLLNKVGVSLKAFLPQLQSTFVKALNEPASKSVRLKAAQALAELARIHPKADGLTADVCKNAKAAEDFSLKETYLVALRLLLCAVGASLTAETKSLAESISMSLIGVSDEPCRVAAGAALGALVAYGLTVEEADSVLRQNLLSTDSNQDWSTRHGNSTALLVALKENASKFQSRNELVVKALLGYISSDRVPVCSAGLRAAGYYLCHQLSSEDFDQQLATGVARSVNHQATDVKLLAAVVLDFVAQRYELNVSQLKLLVPSMVNGTKERNSAVRSACEEALVNLLKLRRDVAVYNVLKELERACSRTYCRAMGLVTSKSYLEAVDAGARESLADVYSKTLQKLTRQQQETIYKELDDTVQV